MVPHPRSGVLSPQQVSRSSEDEALMFHDVIRHASESQSAYLDSAKERQEFVQEAVDVRFNCNMQMEYCSSARSPQLKGLKLTVTNASITLYAKLDCHCQFTLEGAMKSLFGQQLLQCIHPTEHQVGRVAKTMVSSLQVPICTKRLSH